MTFRLRALNVVVVSRRTLIQRDFWSNKAVAYSGNHFHENIQDLGHVSSVILSWVSAKIYQQSKYGQLLFSAQVIRSRRKQRINLFSVAYILVDRSCIE